MFTERFELKFNDRMARLIIPFWHPGVLQASRSVDDKEHSSQEKTTFVRVGAREAEFSALSQIDSGLVNRMLCETSAVGRWPLAARHFAYFCLV